MRKTFGFLSVALLLTCTAWTQTGSPATFNVTGGFSAVINNQYTFDWSLGEETFISTNTFSTSYITHGVLQPEFPNPNISPVFGKYELKIYPNPATDWIKLELNSYNKGIVYLTFYDAAGKLVLNYKFYYPGGFFVQPVYIGSLASAAYMLNVQMAQSLTAFYKNSTYKIIKAK